METENADQPVDLSTTTMEEEKPVDLTTTTMETENVDQPVDLTATTMETENNENIPLSTKTTTITQPVDASDVEEVSQEESNQDIATTESDIPPNKKELMESLTNVVDYITDVVSEKVSQNISASQTGEKQQNGFDSVNTAAQTMANSGGKRRKTRRFKITNKNKTKKI
jgi:hypothetical protein